jgi:hypothetical protein
MSGPHCQPEPGAPIARAVFGFSLLGVGITLAAAVLGVLTATIHLKGWLFGRTVHVDFTNVASRQPSSEQFETAFTHQMTAKGYTVFNCRVTRNDNGERYDGWISLQQVRTSDHRVENDLRDALKALNALPEAAEPPYQSR